MNRPDIYDRASTIALIAALAFGMAVTVTQLRPPVGLVSMLEGTPIWSWSAQAPDDNSQPSVPAPEWGAQDGALNGSEVAGGFGRAAALRLVVVGHASGDAGDGGVTETGPQLEVLVNGSPVADFRYGVAWVVANRGDLLELRLAPFSEGIEVRVDAVLGQITSPAVGLSIIAVPGITELGNIIM